ncbi:hypothetical protein M0R04_08065 [Candidatus Dojkabacteria bacterium]|nr:hypothetical protein [Candidatus Dojkabacteria bacterium]
MKKLLVLLLGTALLLGFTSAKRSYSFPNNPKCNTSYRADTLCRIEKAIKE